MKKLFIALFLSFILFACVPPVVDSGAGKHRPPKTTTTLVSTTTSSVSTTSTSTSTTTTTTPGNGVILFADEFSGSGLDSSKWTANWLGPVGTITKPINGAELSCYDPAQVSVSGGYLHLKAVQRSCKANNGVTYGYASGIVTSANKFTFYQGTIEARVFLPGSTRIDNWPAVWTNGTGKWPETGESDIMEGLNGKACFHYHSPSGGPGGCASGNYAGWHTFKEVVSGSTSTYYYDGVKVGALTNVNAQHFIILNLGISSSIAGSVVMPSEMLVDYVRVTK